MGGREGEEDGEAIRGEGLGTPSCLAGRHTD